MKYKRGMMLVLGIMTVLSGGFVTGCNSDDQTSLLIFSKTEGYRHASIPAGVEAIRNLGEDLQYEIDHTEDASVFESDSLNRYDALILLSTSGDMLNDVQQGFMERYVQSGKGVVAIHGAAATEYDWPWYGRMIGGVFDDHPEVQPATVNVVEQDHPSTAGLPENWQRTDEWYNYHSVNENIRVLLNLDESSYEGGTHGDNHPIAWYHEFDGARIFYTGGGHTDESFSEPLFMDHIRGGLQYVLGTE